MKSTGDVRLSGSRMVRAEAWALVRARGYEGLVAKDSMAPYAASTRWCEVKVRHEARMLIGGIVVTREGYCRLLVGALGGGDFRYLGCVKWGVGRRTIEAVILARAPHVPIPHSRIFVEEQASCGSSPG